MSKQGREGKKGGGEGGGGKGGGEGVNERGRERRLYLPGTLYSWPCPHTCKPR